jgi:hypothetical protein
MCAHGFLSRVGVYLVTVYVHAQDGVTCHSRQHVKAPINSLDYHSRQQLTQALAQHERQ